MHSWAVEPQSLEAKLLSLLMLGLCGPKVLVLARVAAAKESRKKEKKQEHKSAHLLKCLGCASGC